MPSITRAQFIQAVEAGIAASQPPLGQRIALRRLAREATQFGTNYATKPVACPVGQLGLYDEELDKFLAPWVDTFAFAFDRVWADTLVANGAYEAGAKIVTVTD